MHFSLIPSAQFQHDLCAGYEICGKGSLPCPSGGFHDNDHVSPTRECIMEEESHQRVEHEDLPRAQLTFLPAPPTKALLTEPCDVGRR